MLRMALIGLCTFYSPNVMERVADTRGLADRCPDCAALCAIVNGPEWLGRDSIARPGHRAEKFLVVDVSQAEHLAAQQRRGLICEVDFRTARRWGMRGPITVRASVHGAARGAIP
jgi:hypothetical protein